MKKFLATAALLMCLSSLAFPAIGGGKTFSLCHDKNGNWAPADKSCDPSACGCGFCVIITFVKGMIE